MPKLKKYTYWVVFFKSIFLSNVLRHNKQRGTFMIYYNVS